MTGLLLCAIVIGGGALVGQVARRQGRSFVLWSAIATLCSAVAYIVFVAAMSSATANMSLVTISALGAMVVPALPHFFWAIVLNSLGLSTPRNRYRVFPIDGLDDRQEGELIVREREVELAREDSEPLVISLARIDSVRADCECVRLAWRDGDAQREAVLQIVLPDAEWELRATLAEAATQTISRARERLRASPDQSLPRAHTTSRP